MPYQVRRPQQRLINNCFLTYIACEYKSFLETFYFMNYDALYKNARFSDLYGSLKNKFYRVPKYAQKIVNWPEDTGRKAKNSEDAFEGGSIVSFFFEIMLLITFDHAVLNDYVFNMVNRLPNEVKLLTVLSAASLPIIRGYQASRAFKKYNQE